VSLYGTNDEERVDLNKEESRFIRARSRKLLGSLLLPLRLRLLLAAVMVTISTLARVAGPALIALGIDWALPNAIDGNTTPLFVVVAAYLSAATLSAVMVYYFMMLSAKVLCQMQSMAIQLHCS